MSSDDTKGSRVRWGICFSASGHRSDSHRPVRSAASLACGDFLRAAHQDACARERFGAGEPSSGTNLTSTDSESSGTSASAAWIS